MIENEATKKITNNASQLPTYCDQSTNNLGHVTNRSCNTRFTFFFKSLCLNELLKFSNLQTSAIGWKWSQLKKLPTLSVSYQHIVIKIPTNWATFPSDLAILDLFVLQIYVFVRIIKFLKSTNKSVWLKMKSTKKVTNIANQLPTYSDKCTNNLDQVTNMSCNTRFALFFKLCFFYELLKFSNPQIRAFGWK